MFGRPRNDTARIEQLERDLRTLRERLEELEDKHTRLRGRVYGLRLHKPEDEREDKPASTRAESKAELLRRAGYTPGKPLKLPE